jgi:tetratricopeptide repeat protein 21B
MGHPQVGALRGWWELLSGHPRADFLEEISAQARPAGGKGTRNLEATLAEAKYFQMRGAHKEAVEAYNQCIVHFPGFVPALVEKAQAFVLMGDWAQAVEAAHRVLGEDPSSLAATLIVACHALAVDADTAAAADHCATLLELARSLEPRSATLLTSLAQPLARLASRDRDVLTLTVQMVEAAVALDPADAAAHVELGYQRFLLGEYPAAARSYAEADRIEEGLAPALYGTLRCQLALGKLEDASPQIEFLEQMQTSGDAVPPMVAFLAAERAARERASPARIIEHLDRAVTAHMAAARKAPAADAADGITAADPEFAMDLARLYVSQVSLDPSEPESEGAPAASGGGGGGSSGGGGISAEPHSSGAVTTKACELLQWLTRLAPGLVPPRLLLGRCLYALGRRDDGLAMINSCGSANGADAGVHIALAQIYVSQGATGPAMAALEMALAHDFSVREMPLYALVSAEAMEAKGNLSEASRVLETALNSSALRSGGTGGAGGSGGGGAASPYSDVPLRVRVSLHLVHARVLSKLGQTMEAAKVIDDAARQFAETPERVRVTIARCDLALNRGDASSALAALTAVPKNDPYYVQAMSAAARIHLEHLGDKRAYMKTLRGRGGFFSFFFPAFSHFFKN